MLELKNISKLYSSLGTDVQALQDINLQFRKNEFVSILGPSGGGKTTLLNIIGGLDQYTDGDLVINGISTKQYKDKDWDSYRNHSIGFVFQSYNLISHQSVLSNVELALTLSGVSKKERRQRAIEALKSVGLEDQIYKKPNQMSGGQMQRVAIARALVNNPDILLADEPTGALDTVTSVQIMDLLKEIAKDKLVIMVTHNPELAETYSTRIIKILDGKIIDDSDPYVAKKDEARTEKTKKTSMSFMTALSLSFKNLLTKKGRTILTSFAGSIGIIGIAAILALSNGVQNYIDKVQEDTLSSYPLTIEQATFDMTSVMESMMSNNADDDTYVNKNTVYIRPIISDILSTVSSQMKVNNLKEFKSFIESDETNLHDYLNAVQYSYGLDVIIYKENDSKDGYIQSNPNDIVSSIGFSNFTGGYNMTGVEGLASSSVWSELLDNEELLKEQYDLIAGNWPTNYNEVVITVDKNNQINDYILYSLGMKNQDEINQYLKDLQSGNKVEELEGEEWDYDDFINQTFKIVLQTDYYQKENGTWINKADDSKYIKELLTEAEEIKIVGIIRPNENTVSTSIPGSIGYLSSLEEYVIEKIKESDIVKEQMENPDINIFTGLEFTDSEEEFDISSLTPEQQAYLATLSPEQIAELMKNYADNIGASYEKNLEKLSVVNLDSPKSIYLYAKDFDSKAEIERIISEYNDKMKADGKEENVITYSDLVGIMISSVSSIVDIVSYVLIAFVSISLVVSSIMIGIITYISVLERTKEIGILRAIGASKKDVARIFNAETLIIGLVSGSLGILVTILLTIPANIIIKDLTGVSNIAELPMSAALILILISVCLTMIAGLFPSRIAAKKDPVESLRSE